MSRCTAAVLLSIGRNTVSGRPRAAERDARAIAIARASGCDVIGLHGGQPDGKLRDYLGMGLSRLVVVELDRDQDPIPALSAFLAECSGIAVVLAGSRSEAGDGTGLVPYAVAAALDLPILPAVTALEIADHGVRAVQALPGGRRRALHCAGPVMAVVDQQGPPIPQIARGPATRGRIETVPGAVAPAPTCQPDVLETRPARPRPKRIGPGHTQSASGQRLLVRPEPRQAALVILQFLEEERIIAPPRLNSMPPKGLR